MASRKKVADLIPIWTQCALPEYRISNAVANDLRNGILTEALCMARNVVTGGGGGGDRTHDLRIISPAICIVIKRFFASLLHSCCTYPGAAPYPTSSAASSRSIALRSLSVSTNSLP